MPHDPAANPLHPAIQPCSPDASTVDATAAYHSDKPDTWAQSKDFTVTTDLPDITGYVLTKEIARGGMGRVLAGREIALDREVAIKTLLPGSDPSRFLTEARITAKLPHPGIPPVYALGTIADSSPYLAMKLVRGTTLATQLQSRNALLHDLPRYLQIFEQIAHAVGFAHSQNIIHRDLKPANIMVGAFGEVQVMDWGLAKDLSGSKDVRHGSLDNHAPAAQSATSDIETPNQNADQTRSGDILGTPQFMAPEQAQGEVADARADVFALGSILCTILTGKPAFGRSNAYETIQQAASGDTADALGRLNQCGADAEVVQLAKSCLSISRAARPSNGQAVAELMAQYRLGVEARLKQAETERAEAIVREKEQRKRRRQFLVAAALIAAVLLAGIVGTTIGYLRAEENAELQRLAKQSADVEKGKAIEAEKKAVKNLVFARKGYGILSSVFEGMNPEKIATSKRSLEKVLKDNLKKAVIALDSSALDDPLTIAELQHILGTSLLHMGEFAQSTIVLRKAYETQLEQLGPDNQETLANMNNLALSLEHGGNLTESLKLYEKALPLTIAKFGSEALQTLTLKANIANLYSVLGRDDEAMKLNEEILRLRMLKLGPNHEETLDSMNNLALSYDQAGKFEKATPLLKETLRLRKLTLGDTHPQTLLSMNNLGKHYIDQQQWNLAIPLLEETYRLQSKEISSDHPDTMTTLNNLAVSYQSTRQIDRALPLFNELLRVRRSKLGNDHPDTLNSMNSLASCFYHTKQYDKAITLFKETVVLYERQLGRLHPDTLRTLANLGVTYVDLKQYAQALPFLEESYRGSAKHHDLRWVGVALLDCYAKSNKRPEMEKLLAQLLSDARAEYPAGSKQLAGQLAQFSISLLQAQSFAEAEKLLRESLPVRMKLEPDAWTTYFTMTLLGQALLGQQKYAEAEPMLKQGYEGMKKHEKKIPQVGQPRLHEALDRLIQLYTETNKPDEVKKWQAEKDRIAKTPISK